MSQTDDLAIPGFLRRPVTPETKAAVTRISNEMRRRGATRVVAAHGTSRSTISAGHAILDETGKAILKEIRKQADERKRARLRLLKELNMAKKIGKKEQALREARAVKPSNKKLQAAFDASLAGPPKKAKLSTLAADIETAGGDVAIAGKGTPPKAKVSDVTAIPNSEIFGTATGENQFGEKLEKALKTELKAANKRTAKKSKAVRPQASPKASPLPFLPGGPKKTVWSVKAELAAGKAEKATKKKAAKAGGRPDGLREGSKQAVMLDMALAKGGATEAEICKKLGWKKCRVTLKRVAEKVGAKLTRDADGRFHAALKS